MEFVPDTINNARNVAFLNKTKTQAKKLFKLAKQNQLKIEIQNLSHAQEILAQINGFPDWHALEKTINNVVIDNHRIEIINTQENNHGLNTQSLQLYKNIPILQTDNNVTSFISIDYVSSDYHSFVSFVNDIIKATSFQFNMEFHKISIYLEQTKIENQQNTVLNTQYFPINNSENLGLSLNQLKDLLTVSVSLNELKNNAFTIQAYIKVDTNINMIDEHITFCNIFTSNKFKEFFSFKDTIEEPTETSSEHNSLSIFSNQLESSSISLTVPNIDYTLDNNKISVENSHFALTDFLKEDLNQVPFNHSKWIFALYLLSQRQHQWKLEINLLDLQSKECNYFTLSHSENETNEVKKTNNKYLQGLYKSLTSDNYHYYEPIDNSHKKIFSYKNTKKTTLPWNTGIPLINREDNVVDYFQPFSSSQTTYINAIWAKPGSGKSVLMNMLNLSLCMTPGIERLPRIGIVDIGPSSSGLISLLKQSLPKEKQHLVQYHKLKMIEEHCVNIFDTQLGSRFPSAEHKHLLVNMLLLLTQDAYLSVTPQGMIGLIQAIIEDMYFQASDKGQPKRYDKGINLTVDKAIQEIGYDFNFKTTWWEIVDVLFINNMIAEAIIAQRYAVPLLSDASISAQDDKIRDIYGSVKLDNGETLIKYFNRSILDTLNQYRILSRPTVFDISEARIVSLDLDEVAKSGGEQAQKQTAIMYMLARYILGKDFKLGIETINEIPYPLHLQPPAMIPVEKYKTYHKKRFEEYKFDMMQLCFDEFHRVGHFNIIKEQIIMDMREGRKYNLGITIASQSIKDFDETITSFATSVFIMDSGNEKDCATIANTFHLSSSEKDLLLQGKIHGPRSGKPGTMLAKFLTNTGHYTKLVSLPLNASLNWCLSTTIEDVKIKEKLTSILGFPMSIKILSQYYPYGIKKLVEMRKEAILKQDKEVEVDSVIEQIKSELIIKEFKDV